MAALEGRAAPPKKKGLLKRGDDGENPDAQTNFSVSLGADGSIGLSEEEKMLNVSSIFPTKYDLSHPLFTAHIHTTKYRELINLLYMMMYSNLSYL